MTDASKSVAVESPSADAILWWREHDRRTAACCIVAAFIRTGIASDDAIPMAVDAATKLIDALDRTAPPIAIRATATIAGDVTITDEAFALTKEEPKR